MTTFRRFNTREEVADAILESPELLEAAVVAIYRSQTQEERNNLSTSMKNGKGFNKFDSRIGSLMAKSILKGVQNQGKTFGSVLTGQWAQTARRIMPKYSGQLLILNHLKAKGVH